MSGRLDLAILDDGGAELHHLRNGATSLVSILMDGPEQACEAVRDLGEVARVMASERGDACSPRDLAAFEVCDDLVGVCVIDRRARRLRVAGDAHAISRDGPARFSDGRLLLVALAASWPGWILEHEPDEIADALRDDLSRSAGARHLDPGPWSGCRFSLRAPGESTPPADLIDLLVDRDLD